MVEAESSEEAVELAKAEPEFDLVISDLCRPGMDGLAFLKAFKHEHPTVPVVIVSGMLDASSNESALKAGAAACLSKPIDAKTLTNTVAEILSR